jgi:hypothetical protein
MAPPIDVARLSGSAALMHDCVALARRSGTIGCFSGVRSNLDGGREPAWLSWMGSSHQRNQCAESGGHLPGTGAQQAHSREVPLVGFDLDQILLVEVIQGAPARKGRGGELMMPT